MSEENTPDQFENIVGQLTSNDKWTMAGVVERGPCNCPEGTHAGVSVDVVHLAESVRIFDERGNSFAVTDHLAIMHSTKNIAKDDGTEETIYFTSVVAASDDLEPHPDYVMLEVARDLTNEEALIMAGAINV